MKSDNKMKAYIYKEYGGPEVLQMQEVDKPELQEDEVMVKIVATPVNTGDVRIRKADPFIIKFFNGFTPKKQILGTHFAGVVDEVGKNVTSFKKGDQVFGSGGMNFGTFAEYISVKKDSLSVMPKNMSFEEASSIIFGGMTAIFFLKKADIQKNNEVLINAATGAVGIAAVQIAKYYGAKVTAVCSGENFDLIRSLGADYLIDYKQEDFTKNNKKYDIIHDTIGVLNFYKVKDSLKTGGRFVSNNASLVDYLALLYAEILFGKKIVVGVSTDVNFDELKTMIEKNKLKSIIDTVYPFDQMIQAHKQVDSHKKVGNVVVKVS